MDDERSAENAVNNSEMTMPLCCAAIWANNKTLIESLPINSRDALIARDTLGRDSLHYAASLAQSDVVHLVLTKGGDVQSKDSLGNTALHYAVIAGHVQIAQDLIEHGALLNAQNFRGETPVYLATRGCDTSMIKFLLSQCADTNIVTAPNEVSPLHLAAAASHTEICRMLIKGGAHVNAVDDIEETPLHWAVCAYTGDFSSIKFLVEEAEANVNARNEDGETPAHHAQSAGLDIVDYLSSCGTVAVEMPNEYGISPEQEVKRSMIPIPEVLHRGPIFNTTSQYAF